MSILNTGAKNDLAKIVQDGVNGGDDAATIAAALQAAFLADQAASLKAGVAAARQNGNIGQTGSVFGALAITTPGTGYFIGDKFPITGSVSGSTNAAVRVDMVDDVIAGGAITKVSLIHGSGYVATDVLSIDESLVGGGDAVIDVSGLSASVNTLTVLDAIDAEIDLL